jgi:hypothetical protein
LRLSTSKVQAAAGAVEHAGEVLEGEGLGEVVAGADAHGLDRGGDGGEGGHHHHPDLGIAELDLLQQLQAAAAGELEVEQQHVHALALQGGERLRHAARGEGDQAHAGGDLATGLAHWRVVIDDQDAQRGHALGQTGQTVGAGKGRDADQHAGGGSGESCGHRGRDGLGAGVFSARVIAARITAARAGGGRIGEGIRVGGHHAVHLLSEA